MAQVEQVAASAISLDVPRRQGLLFALLVFACFALIPAVPILAADSYVLGLVIRVMIFAIAALSLDFLIGYGALVSFGHAAFIGIGAYAAGILAAHGLGEMFLALPAALAASALFAFLSGIVCLRTKGAYFLMITLAFGQMVFFVASSLAPYGGDDGLTLQSRNTLFGSAVLEDDRALYYFVLISLVLVYFLLRSIVVSRFGRVFRGAKENPVRMSSLGFRVFHYQLVGYVIAGMIAGLAGFLLANATNFVSPAYMSWQRSGELLIMIILGGTGHLGGALAGSMAYLFLEEWLAGYTQNWKMIFGPFLVLVVLFAPGGLAGIASSISRRLRGE